MDKSATSAESGKTRKIWPLALLVALSALLRVWPVLEIDHIWEDAYYYLVLARSLSHGHYDLLGEFHTKYLPGFPLAVVLMRALTFGSLDWFLTGQCVLVVCSSFLPVLCFLLVRRISDETPAAWAAAILASLNPFLVAYSGIPFSECFFAFLLLASLLLFPRAPLLAAFMGGLCALTRHEGWFLLPAFLAFEINIKKEKPFVDFDFSRWKKDVSAIIVFVIAGGFWWALSYIKSGEILSSIYTAEASQKSLATGHSGLDFLAFSFPVAGHFVTLFAVVGLAPAVMSRSGRSMLVFFIFYAGLHMWWVGVLERYFVVLVPLVCVLSGLGISEIVKLAGGQEKKYKRLLYPVSVLLLAFFAGAFHLAGYGPAFVREQSSRSEGYVKAVEYAASVSKGGAVLAYDAPLFQIHAPRTPVIPSGSKALQSAQWEEYLPELYVKEGLRYILWSRLYPLDKKKSRLGKGHFRVKGRVDRGGTVEEISLNIIEEKKFLWKCYYPGPDRLALFRDTEWIELEAVVYKIERAGDNTGLPVGFD